MSYELVHSLNFETNEFKKFLFHGFLEQEDGTEIQEFIFDQEPPSGYDFDGDERRIDDPINNGKEVVASYAVTRHFRLIELQNSGTHIVSGQIMLPATRDRKVRIDAYYKAFFRSDLPEDKRDFARNLFNQYDPTTSPDIYEYFSDNNAGMISHDDFILTSKVVCTLPSQPTDSSPSDRQLLRSYTGGEIGITKFDENGNVTVIQPDIDWHAYHETSPIRYQFVDETVLLEDGEGSPAPSQYVFDVTNSGVDPDFPLPQGTGPLHDLITDAVGVDCGELKRRDYKLLTISSWPEFKIVWVKVRIKIGCDTITISVPRVQTRTARLVAYCYISLPEHFFQTIGAILEACAIRAALEAGVIGIVLGNPAAAAAAFESLFKRCVADEVFNCLHPGLYVLKQRGNWS